MGHKVLIGGTSYEIKGGKTLINGTSYSITKGRTVIGGTGYDVNFASASPILEENDWETIKTIAANGLAATYWAVGDKKSITLSTGQIVNARIIGFNHDVDINGNTLQISFDIEDCINTKYQLNSTDSNAGGWALSVLRSTLNSTILSTLPYDLQTAITLAAKKSSAGNLSPTINTTEDKVWLFSEIELFGSAVRSFTGEGSQYPIFSDNTIRIKKLSGVASTYWTRSAHKSVNNYFACCIYDGNSGSNAASVLSGVSFGFCI